MRNLNVMDKRVEADSVAMADTLKIEPVSNPVEVPFDRLVENVAITKTIGGHETEIQTLPPFREEVHVKVEPINEENNASESFKMPVVLDLRTIKCVSKKPVGEIKEEPQTESHVTVDTQDENNDSDTKTNSVSNGSSISELSQPPVVGGLSKSSKSPAEKLHDKTIPLPYKEPVWSGVVDSAYSFEVLKSGVIVDQINLNTKSFYVVGRLSTCDVIMEHPSISRYHAIIQYRSIGDEVNHAGFYLYDLDSTHGTFLNKQPTKPRCYHRLRVGHMVKFGGSTRMFILQGPEDDQEEESELTVTELIELRKKQEEQLERLEKGENEGSEKEGKPEKADTDDDTGIDWGMGEDAEEDEEDNLADNPFALEAIAPNEDLYIDDPKKTLRGWFEREGYDLEYNVEEKGYSQFLCRIQLPLDSLTGEPLVAEASVKGKKKEAVVACALEACRILDRQGVLRQANHESRKRKLKNWEDEDYYDSDEDTFLDRTGTIEKKRQQRIQKAGKEASVAETFETLTAKYEDLMAEIRQIESAVQKTSSSESRSLDLDGIDDLDAYMTSIQTEATLDKSSRTALKVKLSQLRQEEEKLQRLINIAKPTTLPELKKPSPSIPAMRSHSVTAAKAGKVNEVFSVPESIKKPSIAKPKLQIGPVKLDMKLLPDIPKEENVVTDHIKTGDLVKDAEVEDLSVASTPKQTEQKKCEATLSLKTVEVGRPRSEATLQVVDTAFKRLSEETNKKNQKKSRKEKEQKLEYDATDPDYAVWLPPEGQTGDGRTSLNDKFGY